MLDEPRLVFLYEFVTSAAQYDWLQWVLIIGKGLLKQGAANFYVFAVQQGWALNAQNLLVSCDG